MQRPHGLALLQPRGVLLAAPEHAEGGLELLLAVDVVALHVLVALEGARELVVVPGVGLLELQRLLQHLVVVLVDALQEPDALRLVVAGFGVSFSVYVGGVHAGVG